MNKLEIFILSLIVVVFLFLAGIIFSELYTEGNKQITEVQLVGKHTVKCIGRGKSFIINNAVIPDSECRFRITKGNIIIEVPVEQDMYDNVTVGNNIKMNLRVVDIKILEEK